MRHSGTTEDGQSTPLATFTGDGYGAAGEHDEQFHPLTPPESSELSEVESSAPFAVLPEWPAVPVAVQCCACLGMAVPTLLSFLGTLQLNSLEARLGITPQDTNRVAALAAAAGTLYFSRAVTRLLHSVVLGCLQVRQRYLLGVTVIVVAELMVFVVYFAGPEPYSTSTTPYCLLLAFGGIGAALVEANGYSFYAGFGPVAKRALGLGYAAAWGFPAAVTYTAQAGSGGTPNATVTAVTILVVASISALSIPLFLWFVPAHPPVEPAVQSVRKYRSDLANFREWLPQSRHCLAYVSWATFVSTTTCTILQLYYGVGGERDLLPGTPVSPLWVLAISMWLMLLTSLIATVIGMEARHHMRFGAIAGFLAVVLSCTSVPLLGAVFATSLANLTGSIAMSANSALLDRLVRPEYNLVATSVWFCMWDTWAGVAMWVSALITELMSTYAPS